MNQYVWTKQNNLNFPDIIMCKDDDKSDNGENDHCSVRTVMHYLRLKSFHVTIEILNLITVLVPRMRYLMHVNYTINNE